MRPGYENIPGMFNSGGASDPGYVASLRTPTQLGQLRMLFAALWLAPLVFLGVLPLFVTGEPEPTILGLAATLAVAGALLGRLGLLRVTPILPAEARQPAETAAAALDVLRTRLFVGFALTEAGLLLGLLLALLSGSVGPYLAAFVFAWPALILNGPSRATIDRIKERLESAGRPSYLWNGLLAPIRPSAS